MLTVKNVSKQYGKQMVLEDLSINFEDPHGVYGILGRNGVGKTTLMRIIFNMIPTYQGDVYYKNQSIKEFPEALSEIVYVGGEIYDNNSLFQGNIKKLIEVYNRMYETFDILYAEHLFAQFNISLKSSFSKLSTGNKTLVQNIIGLASHCPITLFDEPTNGLDSVNRQKFFQLMMEDYAENPRMILISTHLIQEVENYLTHVIILKNASVLVDQSLETFQSQLYKVDNYQPEDKNIIYQQQLGNKISYFLYDQLSKEERLAMESVGANIHRYDLQTAFNYLVGE
ncbi:ABC transporter ATP-binding protein [Aerococcaceae bacterium DSM 111020]|nr:ABC transporter ATP-binding protein [Aerococcaceae bacterium DSM 111020]